MLKHIFYIILGLLLCLSDLSAQNKPLMRVKSFTYEDGEISRRVSSVLQDSDGLMWIATVDGLNRYDGFKLKSFNRSNSDLQYEEVYYKSLREDDEGYLWLRYKENIEFIHHRTFEVLTFEERFSDVPFSVKDIKKILGNHKTKTIILGIEGKGSYFFQNGKWTSLPFLKDRSIVKFDNHQIHCTAPSNQIEVYNTNGERLQQLAFDKDIKGISTFGEEGYFIPTFDNNNLSLHLYEGSRFVETINTSFQIKDKHWDYFYYPSKDCFVLHHYEDNQKEIFFLFRDGSVQKAPIEGRQMLVHIDRNDIFWVAGAENLYLLDLAVNPFDYYADVNNARGLWANTEKVFVASSSMTNGVFDIHGNRLGNTEAGLYTIANDKKVLYGGDEGIFGVIDLNSTQFTNQIPVAAKLNRNFWASLKDQNNTWWISYSRPSGQAHICIYSPNTNDSLDIFEEYNGFDDLKNALVLQFLEEDNWIWACSNQGLIRIDKNKGVVGHYFKKGKKGFELPFEDIHHLHKDQQGIYWAATNNSGLIKFRLDKEMKVVDFQQYTTKDFLPSDILYYIIEDDFERLWISTLKGLACFDKKTEQVQIFTNDEVLPFGEFNRTSGFQAIDNRIYFGGVKGAIGFQPSDIDTAQYDKKLMLSAANFYIGNNEERIDQRLEILENNKITLSPNVRFAKIEVALADYFDTKDTRYFYKIEGLHDDFRLMDGNSIQLSNLPYGKYQLRVRGQAGDKRFSTSEINLPLIVVRPFYLRWWFILLGITAVIGLFWLFYNWRVAQLKKRQIELENIVAQRTEQIRKDKAVIEQQAEELKALDKLKDRFFANISHELRTPLTLILGPLGSILKDYNQLSNKHFTYLNVIKRHTNYLMKRINEIMELNRLEVNKSQIDLQPVRLYDFLKVTVGNFESIAPQKEITFSFDFQMKKTIQILIDKDKIEHVIYNYLSNAFKYTPKGGEVSVIVKEVENNIRLEVKDTGVGIPKADIPNLFDRFFQAENAKKAGSSGIGLALCKEIAQLMDGKVWAESEVGKGSIFYFEMPYKEFIGMVQNIEYPISNDEYRSEGLRNFESFVNLNDNDQKPTILLVEDNPELRDYIQAILSEHYHVETAENGKIALEKLLISNYQLLISDMMMPVMNGLELLDHIKKSDNYRHIPMVMLTARQSMEAKLSALQLGVDDYITKPFNEEELLIRIKNILTHQKERLSFIQHENKASEEINEPEKKLTISLSESDIAWLKQLETVVNENLMNANFTAINCAEALHLSKRQLYRRVKKCTGLGIGQYIRLARLKYARQLLEDGKVTTVAETAYQAGFETPAHFAKIFYEEFGKKVMDFF